MCDQDLGNIYEIRPIEFAKYAFKPGQSYYTYPQYMRRFDVLCPVVLFILTLGTPCPSHKSPRKWFSELHSMVIQFVV